MIFVLNLGDNQTGITDLNAQVYDTGDVLVDTVTTGFHELTDGQYYLLYNPDDTLEGYIRFYRTSDPTTTFFTISLEPTEGVASPDVISTGFASDNMFLQTADLKRPINSQRSGGTIPSFSTISAGFSCSIQTMSPTNIAEFARRGVMVDTRIYTRADLGAKVGDIAVGVSGSGVVDKVYIVAYTADMGARGRLWLMYVASK